MAQGGPEDQAWARPSFCFPPRTQHGRTKEKLPLCSSRSEQKGSLERGTGRQRQGVEGCRPGYVGPALLGHRAAETARCARAVRVQLRYSSCPQRLFSECKEGALRGRLKPNKRKILWASTSAQCYSWHRQALSWPSGPESSAVGSIVQPAAGAPARPPAGLPGLRELSP